MLQRIIFVVSFGPDPVFPDPSILNPRPLTLHELFYIQVSSVLPKHDQNSLTVSTLTGIDLAWRHMQNGFLSYTLNTRDLTSLCNIKAFFQDKTHLLKK